MEADALRCGVGVTKGGSNEEWAYAFSFPDLPKPGHFVRMEPDGWFYVVPSDHGWHELPEWQPDVYGPFATLDAACATVRLLHHP